jgi:SAM-dependent methyltransferase
MDFTNSYADVKRAEEYARLEFANTYYLAYRDLPGLIAGHVRGRRALDFGCGTGRSTRFVRQLGFDVAGVDIAPEMIAHARRVDSGGDYRLMSNGDFSGLEPRSYDLVVSLFTFDNIPGAEHKVNLFRSLGSLLNHAGKLISVVSSPEIYVNEWASFSTEDFPQNKLARSGDLVKIITTEFEDRRPTEDILWTDEFYRQVYAESGLKVIEMHQPLARGDEPYRWVSETRIAPWTIYVLERSENAGA